MTWNHLHREEAPNVGEPDDLSASELHGVAPPCDRCGEREAVERQLCSQCLKELDANNDDRSA